MTGVLEERKIPQDELDQAEDWEFAGKNRSFPILKPEDVAAAAHAIGRAGEDNYSPETIKKNIIRIAKRKGPAFVAQLPKAWREEEGLESARSAERAADESRSDARHIEIAEAASVSGEVGTAFIRIISAGWGSTGYYSPEVLRRDGPAAFPRGTLMFLDHPTATESVDRPERSVRDLAGVMLEDAQWRESDRSLVARVALDGDVHRRLRMFGDYVGVSIRTLADSEDGEADGRRGVIITRLLSAEEARAAGFVPSVDIVTMAGRGGRIEIIESMRRALHATGDERNEEVHMPDNHKPAAETDDRDQRIAALVAEVQRLTADLDRYRIVHALAVARQIVTEAVRATALPQIAQDRLITELSADPPTKDGQVDDTALREKIARRVQEEAYYIERLAAVGPLRIATESSTTPRAEDEQQIRRRLAEALAQIGLPESAANVAASA